MTRVVFLVVLSVAALLGAGCGRAADSAAPLRIEWTMLPATPAVDQPTDVELVLRHPDGAAILDADLDLEGHMTHPGMAPVVADLVAAGDGTYRTRLTFTMAGDWVLLVRGRLADGAAVRREAGRMVVRSGG
jgi:hypothetical protein